MNKFAIILLCAAAFWSSSESLSCYQCGSSNEEPVCEDKGNPTNLVQCPSDQNNYCVYANKTENGVVAGVRRYCSAEDITDCNGIPSSPLAFSFSCNAFSCDTDGCNSSTMTKFSLPALILATILPIYSQYF